jgi:hypothetical protein
MARIFPATVGVAYLALSIWCSLLPATTSRLIGFELKPGSGQSEYLVIYGGLKLALGCVFLWPLYRSRDLPFCLGVCLLVHACLVLFRTIGFFAFTGIGTTTYALAVGEWVILLAAAWLWWTLPSAR